MQNEEQNLNEAQTGNSIKADVSRSISLWMEGYAATGESGTAQCIGTYNAVDIDDAVKQYMAEHPNRNSVDWDRFGRGRHAIWACEIFDNEAQARESFG